MINLETAGAFIPGWCFETADKEVSKDESIAAAAPLVGYQFDHSMPLLHTGKRWYSIQELQSS